MTGEETHDHWIANPNTPLIWGDAIKIVQLPARPGRRRPVRAIIDEVAAHARKGGICDFLVGEKGWPPPSLCSKTHREHFSMSDRHSIIPVAYEGGLIFYVDSVRQLTADELKFKQARPGRLFKRMFPDINDKELKNLVELLEARFKAPTVNFARTEGQWAWVYSNGRGFTSCMGLGSRHLHCAVDNFDDLPVRSYALEGNGLSLAWLATDGQAHTAPEENIFESYGVAARAIVNEERKSYVTIYGDSRIEKALIELGYKKDYNMLEGTRIQLRYLNGDIDGDIICPYIDGGAEDVTIDGDTLLISSRGDLDPALDTSELGLITLGTPCKHCGSTHDRRSDRAPYATHEGYTRCGDCDGDVFRAYYYGDIVACVSTAVAHHGDDEYAYVDDKGNLEFHNLARCNACNKVGDVDNDLARFEGNLYCECAEFIELTVPYTDSDGVTHNYVPFDFARTCAPVSNLCDIDERAHLYVRDISSSGVSTCGNYVVYHTRAHRELVELSRSQPELDLGIHSVPCVTPAQALAYSFERTCEHDATI